MDGEEGQKTEDTRQQQHNIGMKRNKNTVSYTFLYLCYGSGTVRSVLPHNVHVQLCIQISHPFDIEKRREKAKAARTYYLMVRNSHIRMAQCEMRRFGSSSAKLTWRKFILLTGWLTTTTAAAAAARIMRAKCPSRVKL